MKETLKVILGVLALTIGASAPTIILEALRPGALVPLNPPSPSIWNTQQERQTDSSEHHANRENTQQNSQDPLSPLDVQQSPNQHAVAAQPQRQGEGESSAEWRVAFWTRALFLATTGLWTFTALLWHTTRQAVIDGEKAIKAAIEHSGHAARAVEVSEDATKRQTRAYVGIYEIRFDFPHISELNWKAPDPLPPLDTSLRIRS